MKLETPQRTAGDASAVAGPGSCVVADAGGRVVAVGDGWLATQRRRRDEVIGRPLAEVLTDPAAAAAVRGDDGSVAYLVADAARERLWALLMQLPVGFAFLAGAEHRVELCNPRLSRQLGRGPLAGTSARELFGVAAAEALDRLVADAADFAAGARLVVRHDSAAPLWLQLEPLRAADGAIEGVIALAIDAEEPAAPGLAVPLGDRERVRLAVATAQLGVWQCDLPAGPPHWDDNLRAQLGVADGTAADRATFWALVHPDDRARLRAAFDAAVATGNVCDVDFRVVAPGDGPRPGRVRWLRAIGRAVYQDGVATRFDGVTIDFTDRRRAESALRRAHDQLAIILDVVDEGVMAHDASGRCVVCNEAAARILGASVAELVGAPREVPLGRWEPRDEAGAPIPFAELPLTRALAGERCERVVRLRRKHDGDERWIRYTATPIAGGDDEEEPLVVSVLRDFTDEKRADQAQQFIAEASRVLGSSLDYESTLRTVAQLAVPHLADWCAVEMKTATGTQQLAVAHVDPAKVEYAWELNRRYPPDPDAPTGVPAVLRSGRPELYPEIRDELLVASISDEEQLRIARALGLRSAIIVPITGARGTVGAITLVSAESGRRYTEHDLTLALELAGRAALAVDNSLLYSDAQRAVRLRDDFLSIAGHELRTPLTALQLQLQGIGRGMRRTPPLAPEQVGARIDKATQHVARLERLINELLDVSRIATGRLVMHPEPVDLAALAAEVIERFADEAQRAQAPLTLRAPAQVIGHFDRLRLDQVLTNLVGNAVKYGAGHPVDVEIGAAEGVARIAVRDRGIGISPADQRRIFGRFERAVSERHYGGLGLGLWIVRQIVESLGGNITLHSEPGVETVFTVELPQ